MRREGLTRREIGWLLAQEARSAARALRRGVELKVRESLLPPPEAEHGPTAPLLDGLNVLDDAIGMLGDLHTRTGLRRRGRIDVASLLYELAPDATITLAAEGGSEVLADQDELTRMLQLSLAAAGYGPREGASPELHVERRDDEILVRTELGPDAAPLDELERRWLHRMATRLGGRVEISGRAQTLVLPAEGAPEARAARDPEVHEHGAPPTDELSGMLGRAASLRASDVGEWDRFAELSGAAPALAASLERLGAGGSQLALALAALTNEELAPLESFVVDETLSPLAESLGVTLLVLARGTRSHGSPTVATRWVELASRAVLELEPTERPTLTFSARPGRLELSLTSALPDGSAPPLGFAWYAARAWAERHGARSGASLEPGPHGVRLLLWVRFPELR